MDYLLHGGDFNKYDDIKSKKIYGEHPANPVFSIIIPTYQRLDFLQQSIKSALAQVDYDNYEIIVVDNDAEDEKAEETLSVIKKFASSKIVYFKNDKNIGIYGNTIRAAKLSIGEYIVLLNDDDLLHPYYLKVVNEFIKKYNYKGIVGSKPYEFHNNNNYVFPQIKEEIHAFSVTKREFFFGRSITSPGFMYPKRILEDIYNAHEKLLMGDQIMQYKGIENYGMMFIEFPLAAYRISDNNATLNNDVLKEMIVHTCKFKKQIAEKDMLLKIFMKICGKEFLCWYIDSVLYFWKKRSLRESIINCLELNRVNKWSLEMIILEDIINNIHLWYSKKHATKYDSVHINNYRRSLTPK